MDPSISPDPLPERIDDERRRQLNDTLTLAVGQGRLDLSEFSELSDAVWSVTDPEQFTRLEDLITGRSRPAEIETLAEKAAPTTRATQVPSFASAVGSLNGPGVPAPTPSRSILFGDLKLSGDLHLAGREVYRLLFGDLHLDLREATLTAPTTVLDVSLIFGDVRLTVPPGVRVDNRMSLVFGDASVQQGPRTAPGAPVVIVSGRAVFGDLRVTVAEPGQTLRGGWRSWLGL